MDCDILIIGAGARAALYKGEEEAELYGERHFRVADLGIRNRRVEREMKSI